jgi:hypothetical protein
LRYRRLDDGVVIYSLGPDRTDDDGNLDRSVEVRQRIFSPQEAAKQGLAAR